MSAAIKSLCVILLILPTSTSCAVYDGAVEFVKENPYTTILGGTGLNLGVATGVVLDMGALATIGTTVGMTSLGAYIGSQIDDDAEYERWVQFKKESTALTPTRRTESKRGLVDATRMRHNPTGWQWDWVRLWGTDENGVPEVQHQWIVWITGPPKPAGT